MKRRALTLLAIGTLLFCQAESQTQVAPDKEVMARFAAAATPGDAHARLAKLAGKWTASGRFRVGPEVPWGKFKAEVTFESLLGGRFIQERILGPRIGKERYEALNLIGFDNTKGKYIMRGSSCFQTSIYTLEGVSSQATSGEGASEEISLFGEIFDPASGKDLPLKFVYSLRGSDSIVLTSYGTSAEGKEYLATEVTYQRVK